MTFAAEGRPVRLRPLLASVVTTVPNPGIALCAAVCGGAVLGLLTTVRWGDALAATIGLFAMASLATGTRGERRHVLALWLLACGGLAVAQGAVARDRALHPPLVAWLEARGGSRRRQLAEPAEPAERAEPSELAEVEGVLAADAARVPGGVRLLIDVIAVRDADGWHRAPGRVQAHVAGDLAAGHVRDWTAGRRVRAPMTLRRPPMLMNFGGASPRWQLLRRPFALAASVKSGALVRCRARRVGG